MRRKQLGVHYSDSPQYPTFCNVSFSDTRRIYNNVVIRCSRNRNCITKSENKAGVDHRFQSNKDFLITIYYER